MSTKLSVNINKIATLRNSRGGDTPNLLKIASDCERFGADGITVHPRPDERHIRYQDVRDLKKIITTEFNVEGNPKEQKFIDLVLEVKPTQVTLVPDNTGQLTSDHGWDTITNKDFLSDCVSTFKKAGIRTSIFVNPDLKLISGAKETSAERIELYTEEYAKQYGANKEAAIEPFRNAAVHANTIGIEINAGHDLSLENLNYFAQQVNGLLEVSIGHALVADALYYGLENTIQLYLRKLNTLV